MARKLSDSREVRRACTQCGHPIPIHLLTDGLCDSCADQGALFNISRSVRPERTWNYG